MTDDVLDQITGGAPLALRPCNNFMALALGQIDMKVWVRLSGIWRSGLIQTNPSMAMVDAIWPGLPATASQIPLLDQMLV